MTPNETQTTPTNPKQSKSKKRHHHRHHHIAPPLPLSSPASPTTSQIIHTATTSNILSTDPRHSHHNHEHRHLSPPTSPLSHTLSTTSLESIHDTLQKNNQVLQYMIDSLIHHTKHLEQDLDNLKQENELLLLSRANTDKFQVLLEEKERECEKREEYWKTRDIQERERRVALSLRLFEQSWANREYTYVGPEATMEDFKFISNNEGGGGRENGRKAKNGRRRCTLSYLEEYKECATNSDTPIGSDEGKQIVQDWEQRQRQNQQCCPSSKRRCSIACGKEYESYPSIIQTLFEQYLEEIKDCDDDSDETDDGDSARSRISSMEEHGDKVEVKATTRKRGNYETPRVAHHHHQRNHSHEPFQTNSKSYVQFDGQRTTCSPGNRNNNLTMKALVEKHLNEIKMRSKQERVDGQSAGEDGDNEVGFPLGKKKVNRYLVKEENLIKSWDQQLRRTKSCGCETDFIPKQELVEEGDLVAPTSMRMTITKRAIAKALAELGIDGEVKNNSNQMFFLFSKQLHITKGQIESNLAVDTGKTLLDPFCFKYADCIDSYPKKIGNDNPNLSVLSSFCCPDGVRICHIPRAAMANNERMIRQRGMLAPHHRLLAFTNESGTSLTHGFAITVYEELDPNSYETQVLLDLIVNRRKRRLAVRRIIKWWRSTWELRPKSTFDGFDKRVSSLSVGASGEAMDLGIDSFQTMNESLHFGELVFVERTYVMIGGNRAWDQSDQFVQLRLLSRMIQMEQEETKSGFNRKVDTKPGYVTMFLHSRTRDTRKSVIDFRHEYLQALHQKLSLPKCTSAGNTFEINLPTFSRTQTKARFSFPLPFVVAHFGVASLLARISSNDLMTAIQMLLLERSVLVLGERPDIVSASVCALAELIKPFELACNFMPILPNNNIDFLRSRVPFLVGMVASRETERSDIKNDKRVLDAMNNGLNVIDLCSGSANLTLESNIVETLQACPTPRPNISVCKQRLTSLRKNNPSLSSLSFFIKNGLSCDEIVAIDSVRGVIRDFVEGLADDVINLDAGWKQYIRKYRVDGTCQYYPSLFVQRRREHFGIVVKLVGNKLRSIENRLQFQEMLARSQLFIELVDRQRSASVSIVSAERYIANWILRRFRAKKG